MSGGKAASPDMEKDIDHVIDSTIICNNLWPAFVGVWTELQFKVICNQDLLQPKETYYYWCNSPAYMYLVDGIVIILWRDNPVANPL